MNKKNTIVLCATLAAVVLLILSWFVIGPGGSASRPSLLLITLDTTRADRLGCYGHEAALTPALDRLASEGALFEQAFANVPITLPSHATIMTGLQPPEHGLRVNGTQRLDVASPTLAELLQESGYQTAAFIASATLDSQNGLDRGFDIYQDDMSSAYPHDSGEPLTAYRPGDAVTDLALEWLAERDGGDPFFCWVHLFDPHHPYFAHEALEGTRFEGRKSYDAEVAFMDMQVGRLLDFLEREGLRESVLVVAAGDHGEGLADDREKGHGHMLYDFTLRVPLIFARPGSIPPGIREEAMVSLVDLHGTILDLLGVSDTDARSGRSLAPALAGGRLESLPCYGETDLPYTSFGWSPLRSLTTPEWKYIRSARRHLYDRVNDPMERENRAESLPDRLEEMESALLAVEREMVPHTAAEVDLSPEDIARLASLGYVAGAQGLPDSGGIDYSSLSDVEDMVPVLEMLQQARAAGRENRGDDLIALLRRMLELSPESSAFRERLAMALLKDGRLEEGLAEIKEYLRRVPGDADARYVLGVAHARRNELLPAARAFLEVLRIRPDDDKAHEAMATLLMQHNDPVGASRHRERRSDLPGEAVAHYDLGVLLTGEGRVQEAVAEYEEALLIEPRDLPTRYRLAGLLETMGDTKAATEQYAEALGHEMSGPDTLLKMSEVLVARGNVEAAILYVARALELRPGDEGIRSRLAELRKAAE
jgi:arylsulfatase A-like enzyme/tetratricopeptide (TPR) repeat protein